MAATVSVLGALVFLFSGGTKPQMAENSAVAEVSKPKPKPPPPAPAKSTVTAPVEARQKPVIPAAPPSAPQVSFVNTLGMKFVALPGTDELICIHETRRKDYAAYADAVPGVDESWKAPVIDGKPLVQSDDHPVVAVSWEDATAFCAWLSQKEGRSYRLPSEHEWNLAVADKLDDPKAISPADLAKKIAPQNPWGTGSVEKGGNYDGGKDGHAGTAPVMSFLPNHLGIYDLGGNAWEWCDDLFAPDQKERVLRGCGYRNFGGFLKSGNRQATPSDFRTPPRGDSARRVPGFRVVAARAATMIPVATVPATTPPTVPAMKPGASDVSVSSPADPVSARLSSLEKTFQDAYEKQAGAAHKAAVADLNTKFTAALDRSIAAVSQAGKLDEALALRNEKTLIQTSGAVPEEDAADTPEILKTLRKTYRATMTTLVANRDKSATPLHAAYDRALASYQEELTKAQKLDDALRVKAVREHVSTQRETPVAPQPTTPATGAAISSAASGKTSVPIAPTAPPLAADKVLPPPPKATSEEMPAIAESLLQVIAKSSGNLTIFDGVQQRTVQSLADLPKGKINIVRVYIYGLPAEDTDKTMALIAKLHDLESLAFKANPGKFPIEQLRGLTKLKNLEFSPRSLDEAAFAHLTGLKALENFAINGCQQFTGLGLGYLNKDLKVIALASCPLSAEGLAYLPRFKKLTKLNLTNLTTLNDTMLTGLAALPDLDDLYVPSSSMDGSFLGHLPPTSKLRLLTLGDMKTFKPENLAHIAKLKQLEVLSLPPVTIGSTELAALGSLRMLRDLLVISNATFTGEGFKGLKGFGSLTLLELGESPVTDAGLAAIAETLPHLKDFRMTHAPEFKSPSTAAGFAVLTSRLKELKELQLIGSGITDDWMPAIAQAKGVDYLMLFRASVTDQGVAQLMKLPLGYLRLDNTQVTDAVIPILKTCPTLVNVPVNGTKMTDAGKAELLRVLDAHRGK